MCSVRLTHERENISTHTQTESNGFYNRDWVCLLRGTSWVYIIQVKFSLETVNPLQSLRKGSLRVIKY